VEPDERIRAEMTSGKGRFSYTSKRQAMNSADPAVFHSSEGTSLVHEVSESSKQSAPAKEPPAQMKETPHEIFYDAREVYGGY
jgi:hypothetical protein